MEIGNFKMHRRARMAFQQLEADEQARVRERLMSLGDTPAAQWPSALARRLPGEQPLYLVRVDDSWRLFVGTDDGQPPEVLDIVRQEMLDFYAQADVKAGA